MGNIPRRRFTTFSASEEKIGYCRPPKHSQFKPGHRPKGRPKGSRNFRTIARSILRKRVRVTRNGKTYKIPAFEALMLRELDKAYAGDARARDRIFQYAQDYLDEEVAATVAHLAEEDAEVLRIYHERLLNGAAAATGEKTESGNSQTPPESTTDNSGQSK
jgi:hypothetical protein